MKATTDCRESQIARKNREAATSPLRSVFKRMRMNPYRTHARAKGGLVMAAIPLVFCWASTCAAAVAPGLGGPKTTVVIFSDHPMSDATWSRLFTEVQREATAEARNILSLDANPLLIRGMDLIPGQLMENPIVVKLHGDCRPPVGVTVFPSEAPLGWVRREEGHISPFIQVDCTRVAQVVSARLLLMDGREKSSAMCVAIARVILHEWIHIAEQSDRHSLKGIEKRRFGSEDLLSGFESEVSSSKQPSQRAGKSTAKSQLE